MPRRSILSAAERESPLALPDPWRRPDPTFNDTDLSIIRQRRGPANRLGFCGAALLPALSGVIRASMNYRSCPLLKLVADQLKVGVESWNEYGQREQTPARAPERAANRVRFRPFTMSHYRQAVQMLTELAMQNRQRHRAGQRLIGTCGGSRSFCPPSTPSSGRVPRRSPKANWRIYDALAEPLADAHRRRLDDLLKRRDNGKTTRLAWLRQSPPSQIRGICWNTSNALLAGRHSICLPASSGWFTRTACSRFARAAR